MGRHSAPDDDEESGSEAGSTAVASPPASDGRPRPGRHSHADEALADGASVDHEGTAEIDPIVDPVLDEPVPAAVTTVIAPIDGGRGDDLVDDLFDADEPTAPAAPEKAEKTKKVKPPKEPKPPKAAKPPKPPKEPKAPKPPKEPKPAKPKRPEPHVSDRALLRADSSARARVIAAVVAPFVLYVVVLLALDALDVRTLLIWIWVPLITAGVVAGLILDLAHRAAANRTAPTETKT